MPSSRGDAAGLADPAVIRSVEEPVTAAGTRSSGGRSTAAWRAGVNADEISSEVLDENSPVGCVATRLVEARLSVAWAACPDAEVVGAAV